MTASPQIQERSTFHRAATDQLVGLWRAVHGLPCPQEVHALLQTLTGSWGRTQIPVTPPWPSDIGDEHSPFEFSVAFTRDNADIRFLVEAQGDYPDFASTRDAALSLGDALAQKGASLARLKQVSDIFLPSDVNAGRFALWHAVAMAPGPVRAKAYLNPQIRGDHNAGSVAHAAFDALGLRSAWRTVESLTSHLSARNKYRYFALDLTASPFARAKIYLYLTGLRDADLDRLGASLPDYAPGQLGEFIRTMTGVAVHDLPRPVCIYLAFTGDDAVPSEVTLQLPVRHYVPNDGTVRTRLSAYLDSKGIGSQTYLRVLEAISRTSFNSSRGLHTYASLRAGTKEPRVVVYLASHLYAASARDSGVHPTARRDGSNPRT